MSEDEEVIVSEEKHPFTCERCGFIYSKGIDFHPYLCYRCIRFIAKKVFTIMHTIQLPTSVPDKVEI